MKHRDITLDIIRIMACMMVVAMHSPIPSTNASGPFLVGLCYFTEPCIGLFFMVSGALLLPVKKDYVSFLKHRLGKVVGPTIFWTFVYICLDLCYRPDLVDSPKVLASIPFSAQGNGVLWFMYTLIGLYLIAPIVGAWLENARKQDLQIVLGLWCVTLCYPFLEYWIDVNYSVSGILYYMGGYAGYFIMGYYMKKYPEGVSPIISGTIAVAGSILLLVAKKAGIEVDTIRMFGYLSIFMAAMTTFVWSMMHWICKHITFRNVQIKDLIFKLSNLSFGVYLVHIALMRYLLWKLEWINNIENYVCQTAIVIFLTILSSFAVCWFVSLMPLGYYTIGYRRRAK